jgi:hypothetical protein
VTSLINCTEGVRKLCATNRAAGWGTLWGPPRTFCAEDACASRRASSRRCPDFDEFSRGAGTQRVPPHRLGTSCPDILNLPLRHCTARPAIPRQFFLAPKGRVFLAPKGRGPIAQVGAQRRPGIADQARDDSESPKGAGSRIGARSQMLATVNRSRFSRPSRAIAVAFRISQASAALRPGL